MSRRRGLPVVMFVAAIGAMVAIRVVADKPTGSTGPTATTNATASKAADARIIDGIRFTDVTKAAGLDEPQAGDDESRKLDGESAMTGGAAIADVNGDGTLDVFLPRVGAANRLMLNDGHGTFTEASANSELTAAGGTAAFADVNGDGLVDLALSGFGTEGPKLYLASGPRGSFTDATAGSGLDSIPKVPEGQLAQAHGITFADYDHDGRLDLLLTHWDSGIARGLADPAAADIRPGADGSIVCARAHWLAEHGWPRAADVAPNRGRLFHNEGNGRFRDVTTEVGLPFSQIMGFTGRFVDVDGDGWDDLAITGDFCTSRLFRNVGGARFEDITASAGVGTDENGMGSVLTDLDGNGTPDWFVTGIGPVGTNPTPLALGGFGNSGNRAYLNDGTGHFTDATDRLGVRNTGWAWGAAIADFANSGRPAFAVTNGYSINGEDIGSPAHDPTLYLAADPTRPQKAISKHTDVTKAVGIDDRGLGRAVVPFDMDRDGDLDLLVVDFGGAPHLYRNDSPKRHWLTVRLDDPSTPGNRQGVGAKVVVRAHDDERGGTVTTRWLVGGGSYESQDPLEVHVGLGTSGSAAVDRVEVTWPGSTTPQIVERPKIGQVLTITRA